MEDYDTAKALKLRMDALRRGESGVVHNNNAMPRQQQQQQIVVDEDVEEKHTIDRDFKQSFGSAGEEKQRNNVRILAIRFNFRVIEKQKSSVSW